MKESTGVFLGFGAVALFIAAVPVAFLFFGSHVMDKPLANVDGPISRAFLGVDVDSNGAAEPVPAIDNLLPLGMPADTAVDSLQDNGFDCTKQQRGTVCSRTLNHGSASERWTVTLTFGADGSVASRSGTTQAKSL